MLVSLAKDHEQLVCNVKDDSVVLLPKHSADSLNEDSIISGALEAPIGTPKLSEIVCAGEKVAIIVSDITRPVPTRKFLPQLLAELKKGGVAESDVIIVCALGSHRKQTDEERKYIVGDAVWNSGVTVMDSDVESCRNIGTCANGTPVDVFIPVLEADRVICTGNVEYHYFAGYSGGAKAIMPGVSSLRAIRINHSNMLDKNAATGRLDVNPVRCDIDEIGKFIKIDFIFNVVLDEHKNIAAAFCGDYIKAHRAACANLDVKYKAAISGQADVVLVSSGGFPKDINLYQAQKALDNAKYAVKDGGTIILCASAKEGFGSAVFEQWMLG